MTGLSLQHTTGSIAALVVFGVIAWAGVAKLTRPVATQASFRELRLPIPRLMATAVPASEVAVGALCLMRPQLGCAAAAVLLLLFTALLAFHLRRGSHVSCGCFGSADPSPVTWVTLVRNGALVAVAVVGAAFAPRTFAVSFGDFTAVVVGALCMATLGALVFGLITMKRTAGAVFAQSPPARRPAASSGMQPA